MKRYIIILLLLFSLGACERAVDWPQKETFTPMLVVEAMVTNRPGFSYVKLSLPVSDPGDIPLKVSGAQVVLTTSNQYYLFSEDSLNSGLYLPDPSLRAVSNRRYGLFISVAGYDFFASAVMVPVAPLDSLKYREVPSSPGNYRINLETSGPPSMVKHEVNWESDQGNQEKSLLYSYSLNSIDVNQFFKPEAETLMFPEGSRVIRTRFSLAPDHEKYIRSLLSETEWKGGWFDLLPGNLHTNLSTGAVGYFAACSVVSDTTFLQ